MPPEHHYETMEHTADAAVKVSGTTLEELLAGAAYAMFHLQYGLEGAATDVERVVEAGAPEKEMLAVRLLTLLLGVSESEGLIFKEFDVTVNHDPAASSYRARCVARGTRFDPAVHARHIHVKAVTYHMLEVAPEKGYAVVLFDK